MRGISNGDILGFLNLSELKRHKSLRKLIILTATIFMTSTANLVAQEAIGGPLARQPAALEYAGIYPLKDASDNLTGEGVTIAAVCRSFTYINRLPQDDYRLNMEHKCFLDSDVYFADGSKWNDGVSSHTTTIGAILVGGDPNGYHPELGGFVYEGVCPQAQLDVHEFWRFVSSYVFGGIEIEADIITMSVGEVFEDWWTRGIERIAEKEGIIVVAGIGNGSNVFDPLLYPAAGENVIGVGVIDSVGTNLSENLQEFSIPHSEYSSSGPTYDQRSKPDIVAPGNCLVPSAQKNNGYEASGDWSSFATPIVAGTIGLLVQQAKSDPDLASAVAAEGGNCVTKAIVMNSATKLPYWHKGAAERADDHEFSLDEAQGAGAVNAERAYEQLTAGRWDIGVVNTTGWDNNVIEKGQEVANVYRMGTPEGSDEYITVTLVWNKHYVNEYPFESLPELDSDLRLELWAVDENEGTKDYLIDYSDSANDNVEHIYCAADPNYTTYEIVVMFGQSGVGGETERYGLAWNVGEADSTDNIWWNDLNDDGKVDSLDHVAFAAIEKLKLPENEVFLSEALKLSDERITLLLENKTEWKKFWTNW